MFARVSLLQHTQARMHVVYVVPDGDEPQPFEPWIRYVQETDGMRRLKWQREAAGAVCLLLDYAHAHGAVGAAIHADTLRGFAEALLCGTQHLDEAGRCGLWWAPRSRARATRCLSLVTAFLDWIAERLGRPNANPWRDATAVERLAQIRRLDKRAARSLLSHAAYRHRDAVAAGRIREVRIAQGSSSAPHAELRAFSENDFERFLEEGLARPAPPLASWSRRHRLRDVLVSILLHGGGLRLSEPFHIYLEDVQADPLCPTSALVRLFHPELGQAPVEGERRWRDREHYLRERWNRLPRTLEQGRFHAGWKNLALSDGQARCAFVHWAPMRWGEIFLDLFRLYIAHRPRADHPFAFVSEHPHHRGAPYTIESFTQVHARAVRRIGLVPGKSHGTSPHAHRHAYGRRLRAAGVQSLFIQRAMHHRSADSQLVYTAPSMAELAGALRAADARMKSPSGLPVCEGVARDRI